MAKRILVTGAQGFVGRHLIAMLMERLPDAQIFQPHFDVTDPDATRCAVMDCQPDICVHLAAIAAPGVAQSDPDAAWKTNLLGTLILARALADIAPGSTLIFVSSADVYGSSFVQFGPKLDEAAPLAPMNTYGATKAAADLALGAMQRDDLRIIRVRPFNHTGVRQSAAFVVPAFARQVAMIEAGLQAPVVKVGGLQSMRDFLDVDDVCAAYTLCIAKVEEVPSGTVLNIASGTMRRIGTILDELIAMSSKSIQVETDESRVRPSEIPAACGDASYAARLLSWAPQIPWATTLSSVMSDWRTRVREGTHA